MKNFTKQNFKTNPLWVRLLIMTCMLLAGSSSAWAASLNTNAGDNRASGVEIQYNSTSKWYRIGTISNMWNNGCTPKMSGSQNNPLDGHKFGTITTLKLKGGEVNTRLNDCNSGCGDYAEARYSYKIYKTNVSEPSNYTTGFTANTWECGSRWDNASDVSIYNSADINLLSGLGAGDYNLKMKMDIQARWSGGTYGNTWSHTASATFTVPGYSTTTGTLAIGEVNIGSNKSSSKAMTHYGSTTTATAEVSGTDASEFTVTSVSATSVTVKFTPTSAGSKTAKVTVTDAYKKTYTLTVTGTGKQACEEPTSVSISRGNPTTGNICQNSTIDLTAQVDGGSGDITYAWTKTSGGNDWTIANASAQKCTVTVGTGSATFQISAKRCNTTKTATVTLTADATPAITLKAGPTICSGTEVTFASYVDASSIGEITWHTKPDFSDAAITSAKPNATTTYYAKATNGVCSTPATASLIVTVKAAPAKPAVTLSPADGNIVSGGGVSTSATLTVTPQDDVTFTLYKDGESTGRTENPFDNITEAGEYYVIGTNTCGDPSPASDSKTITVCTIGSTLDRAEYDPATQKVNLEGTFEVCGKNSFYGFQWRKVGSNWCDENQGNENSNYVTLGTTTESATKTGEFSLSSLEYSYEFRTYVVPVGGSWVYGNVITVYPCINIETPDIDPVAICAGSTATLTLKNKQNGVTYKIDGTPIFTDGTTHTVKPDRTTTYTITATSTNSCDANQKETATVTVTVNAIPSLSPSATVVSICEGETKTIKITTNAESIQWYKDGAAIDGATSAALDITKAGTYYAKVSNATTGCSNQSINFEVANAFGSDITPTITGAASVQSGAANITYSTANVDGALYEWQLPTGWTFSGDKDGNQITVSVPDTDGDGTITVRITKNSCTKTATLDVAWMDGFTVYLRRPHAKNETTQYNYWFEKSNAAGPGYIKFGTVKASPSDSEIYTYNGGTGAETTGDLGTKGTESFTDCDGYVWDAYNIGIDVTALYFHAPNNKSTNGSTYGGHATYTRSYSQATAISEDLYFTMGNWTNQQKGRTLTKVEKPFEGIEIEALGDTEICSNNMASFAALYLSSNCTGKSVKSYAWKVSSDEEEWNDYTTGKGATSNNIRPNVAGHYRLECELEDGNKVVSNSIEITTKTCTISNADLNNITSNLPIIMVNTGDKAFPSVDNGKHCSASADDLKKKRSVDVKILWNKNGTVSSTDAYSNGATLYYDRKARMNYRGSSSLNFEKKSYAFCPGDENCGQDEDESADYVKTKKMNMFGIGEAEDKDWVLYAAYVDPSMMRNILAMETYSAMTGKWGVKNQYVELYIDGQYQGVYVFMDKVTQNKKRVDIKWDVKDDTKREFILKFDKTDAADRYELSSGDQKTFESDITGKTGISTYDTEVDQRFEIEYPEKEDIEDDGGYWSDVYSFVLGKVNEFESALSKGDFTKVRDLINYESWADFFILNEFTKNVDAYRASCIFVYTGGKFEAWPLWDYELSFNNTVTGSGKGRGDINGLLIEHSDVYSDEFPAPFWWTGKYNGSNMYSGLLKDPCFLQKIKERWALHTKEGGALHPTTTTTKTAAYKAILDAKGAATREFKKWPVTSRGKDACSEKSTGYYNYGGGGATNYDNSYNQLNEWLKGDADTDPRITGLQKEIDKFDDVIKFGISSTIDKEETTPWRAVNVTVDAVGADFTYTITPEITKGQVIEGSGNLLIYAELPQTYTVVTTLDAKDQCGANPEDNAQSSVTFTVNDLVDNCEE